MEAPVFADSLSAGVKEREESSQNSGRIELFHLRWWAAYQAAAERKLSGNCVQVLVVRHQCLYWREIWNARVECWR